MLKPPQVRIGYDYNTPDCVDYEEVIFDYKTNRYLTLSQEREIQRLNKQLQEVNVEKKKKLEHIIGYYYKRN